MAALGISFDLKCQIFKLVSYWDVDPAGCQFIKIYASIEKSKFLKAALTCFFNFFQEGSADELALLAFYNKLVLLGIDLSC